MTNKKDNPISDDYFSKNHKKRFNKKVFFIVTIATVIILAIGVIALFIINSNNNTGDKSNNQPKAIDSETSLYDKVSLIIDNNGLDAGIDFIEEEIDSTDDPAQKAGLYITKSSILAMQDDKISKSEALKSAYDAESTYQSTGTALAIANNEERLGNLKDAIKYYRIYLERVPEEYRNDSESDYSYDYYSVYAEDLEDMLQQ